MSMFEKLQQKMEKVLIPISDKILSNKSISVISSSMLKMMPVFIGGAIFSLLSSFPITAVQDCLKLIGIKDAIDVFVSVQSSIIPLLNAMVISYQYAKNEGEDGLSSGIFALVIYFVLMPIGSADGTKYYALSYMGTTNTFASMIIGVVVAKLYVFTMKKNIKIKFPDSVPPMVSKPFESIFSGIIIVGIGILVNFIFSLTPFGNYFDFIFKIVQTPIMSLGATVPAMIIVYTLCSVLWFFGIHPSAVMAVYSPVLSTILGSNYQAFAAGNPLPYFNEGIVYLCVRIGGTGSTLGLVLVMLLMTKSKRNKELNKLALVPGLFNINEPLTFGLPIMMNPIFFVPMLLSAVLSIGVSLLMGNILKPTINTLVQMTTAWTMPAPITAFMAGGIKLLIVVVVTVLADALLWAPFYAIYDKKALKEEEEQND